MTVVLASLLSLMLAPAPLAAQSGGSGQGGEARRPPSAEEGPDAAKPPVPTATRGTRAATLVLKVGTVHPVSGPAIQNGAIVIRGGRIFAVGPADKLRLPRNAQVLDYPEGHAYPGLVDAQSTAYTSAIEAAYGNNSDVNAGTDFADALDPSDEESRKLIRYGITTAYVSNRSNLTWRGRGTLIRPNSKGFGRLTDKPHGGLSLRMTTGAGSGHALDRLKMFDKTGNAFDGLDDYETKQKDYAKALADYARQRKTWLEYYTAKASKPATKGTTPAAKAGPEKPPADAARPALPATKPPTGTPPEGGRTGTPPGDGRRGRGSGSGRRGGTGRVGRGRPGTTGPTGTGEPATAGNDGARQGGTPKGSPGTAAKPPEKPKWPKEVKPDPVKEALLEVVKGKLPLRVEVHRHDEIRAALFMAMAKELPGITLEGATDAADIASEVAEAGAPVVITDLLPGSAEYEKGRDGSLPAVLHRAGVAVAIGSGTVRNARNLTLMAAHATGMGLPPGTAVRALTLTPAEILGIADKVGSLERNKLADVIITSGPLLDSGTRVLRVLSQGQTQYEAGQPSGNKPSGNKASENKPSETRPSANKTSDK